MPRFTPRTRALSMPDLADRFGASQAPPDGYVITFSALDGYYLPRPTSRLQSFSSPVSSPYNITTEDVVLVQNHVGAFTVNLPVGPTAGTTIYIKDFAGVAAANPINVVSAANIDGAGSFSINTNYSAIRVIFNGTTWSILSRF